MKNVWAAALEEIHDDIEWNAERVQPLTSRELQHWHQETLKEAEARATPIDRVIARCVPRARHDRQHARRLAHHP